MNKNYWLLIAATLLTGSACLNTAISQEKTKTETQKDFDRNELVVTATPVTRKAKDITSAISVIDSAEIEASNADYVMDVIGSLPSVYIQRDAILGRQDIAIRGLGSNLRRLQTLIDGRPEKMSLFGCTVAQTLPLANVERIEVIRGPEAVLHGTDAMGGVVNIITRRKWDRGYESNALLSYGSHDTFHGLLRHSGNTGTMDYYITYDHKETEGHRDNSAYDADFFSLRTGYQLDDIWRLELSGQYFRDKAEDPGPENNPYTNNDKKEYIRYSWDADLIGKKENSEFLLTVYNNEGEHDFNMPSISDYWHSKDRTLGVLTRCTRDIYEHDDIKDALTVGYEFKHQWAEPQDDWVAWARANMPARFMDFGPYERNNHDVFAFNELVKGRWVQTLGLRGHWDDEAEKWEALPQAGVLCHVTKDTTARAKVAKGFRQPRFSELHLFPAHNEDLEPEEVWSYEVALNHAFTPRLSAFVNPFYMDVQNFVQQEANTSPPPEFLNINSGEFTIQGVEVGLDSRPIDDLNMTVHYTYTEIEDGPSGNPHANREGKPEHVVNATAGYRLDKTKISLEGEYIAGLYDSNLLAGGNIEKVDNFFVFDLKSSYLVNPKFEIFAGIENLLDEDYEQIPGYPMPGTTVFAGIKARM
ncbi:MAG: TonB-dependent receptor [Verrucomicrobiota bacterium]